MSEEATITENDELQTADSNDGAESDAGSDVGGTEPATTETDVATTDTPPAPPVNPPSSTGNTQRSRNELVGEVDVDAALNAKEALAEQLEKGEIGFEDYSKQVVKHDRTITKAQRQMADTVKPVAQTIQRQNQATQYWSDWGKGTDVAQKMFGSSITSTKAAQLFQQAVKQVSANPRYAGRAELDANSIVYDKWMDLMEAETKKPKQQATPPLGAPPSNQARVTGNAGTVAPMGSPKSAQQKLEDGDYGDLSGEMKKIAGW